MRICVILTINGNIIKKMSDTQKNVVQQNLGKLLNESDNIKIYTCEDFKGNIEITVGKYMYLFYAKKIKDSVAVLSEAPVDVYDMEIEKPTPGSNNYLRVEGSSVDEKTQKLLSML